jgi:hypothetical protein
MTEAIRFCSIEVKTMVKFKSYRVLILSITAILLGASNSFPCKCISPGTACPSLPDSHTKNVAVFVGIVTEVTGKSFDSLMRERGIQPGNYVSERDWNEFVESYKALMLEIWKDDLSDADVEKIRSVRNEINLLELPEILMKKKVRLRVVENFFGPMREEFELFTGLGDGDCGVSFETGKTYLVYAHGDRQSNVWFTGVCDGSGQVELDGQDVRTLRDLKSGRVFVPRIYGRLYSVVVKEDENPIVQHPGNRSVVLSREGRVVRETQADESGRFLFGALEPGEYRVEVPGSRDTGSRKEITLSTAGCARVAPRVEPN